MVVDGIEKDAVELSDNLESSDEKEDSSIPSAYSPEMLPSPF